MQVRRQADVNEVNLWVRQNRPQVIGDGNRVRPGDGPRPVRVQIADRANLEATRQGAIALQMLGPDPGPDPDADRGARLGADRAAPGPAKFGLEL